MTRSIHQGERGSADICADDDGEGVLLTMVGKGEEQSSLSYAAALEFGEWLIATAIARETMDTRGQA
ncbi:hypothetical protein ASG40_11580 [Methylobacterium sp. Leaf399]|uniref:hypothetical protein n=1 Tax=Methylobacterium sp. Leaf399 TaxID=1736364 RepID=UPI0006F20D35|nr:hypothetical protein [Methylobacterium sp. Leaf399]KQT08514.1 hypothetical protein ASG40_11580 [Methylobacterium sp. Leaf399]